MMLAAVKIIGSRSAGNSFNLQFGSFYGATAFSVQRFCATSWHATLLLWTGDWFSCYERLAVKCDDGWKVVQPYPFTLSDKHGWAFLRVYPVFLIVQLLPGLSRSIRIFCLNVRKGQLQGTNDMLYGSYQWHDAETILETLALINAQT